MFSRTIGTDVFLETGDTTVRSTFVNSRLETLNNASLYQSTRPKQIHVLRDNDNSNSRMAASLDKSEDIPAQSLPNPSYGAIHLLNDGNLSQQPLAVADLAANKDDWWLNAIEEDTFDSPLAFDSSEDGLWNGRFVPPPPRPPFLDENVEPDGLTTCDLCTWAWQRNAYSMDAMNSTNELSWAFTLIIVSIVSALVGAIVMVSALRCKRIKTNNANGNRSQAWWCRNNRNSTGSNMRSSMTSVKQAADIRRPTSNSGVWTWLGGSRRSSASPDQIGPPSSSPAENHYTHMDDAYSPVVVNEALYTELDRESVRSANPSYQNTAYSQCGERYNYQQHEHEHDIPMVVSSAPSSAYYSDLSMTAMPGGGSNERAYEIVGLTVMSQPLPNWDMATAPSISETAASTSSQRRIPRLAAITETSTSVPSDFV